MLEDVLMPGALLSDRLDELAAAPSLGAPC